MTGRLLTINSYHYRRGGADVACLDQEAFFAGRGWEVAKFAMHHPDNLPSPWSRYFASEIELASLRSLPAKLAASRKVLYSREAANRIGRLIDDFKPDVVHAHNVYHHLSPSVLRAAKQRGIPVVMTLHDTKLLCPAHSMWQGNAHCEACKPNAVHNVLLKRCLKGSAAVSFLAFAESALHRALGLYSDNVDQFVVPSQYLIDRFVDWGWNRDRFSLIRNAVALDTFPKSRPAGEHFLFFGRLAEGKGLECLLEAAAKAGVSLRVVGTGPLEESLKAMAARLGAKVEWTGALRGDALWSAVADCRAVVLPAEAVENAPLSILEAYAMGRPVVASSVGGIPEMVESGRTGSLFQSGDVAGLAALLQQYSQLSPVQLGAMSKRCRELVERHYSMGRQYDSLVALYSRLGAVSVDSRTLPAPAMGWANAARPSRTASTAAIDVATRVPS